MSTTVSCYLMGGLGNQLFQIFNALSYGIDNNYNVVFPYTNSHLKYFPIYKEKNFTYNTIPQFDNNTEIMLYGYFQSYRYFQKNEINIFSLIKLDSQQDEIKHQYRNLFDTTNTCVSMHFRIGDYKNIQHMHPIIPYNYYEESIQKLLNCTDNKCFRVLYFCQDIDNSTVEPFIERLKNKFNSIEKVEIS